jgi:L-threonylcarbamoyladenylate synthase
MDPRHYAPRARVIVSTRESIASHSGERVGVVLRGGAEVGEPTVSRVLPDDPELYARALFATLHELDDAGCDVIVVEDVPDNERWWAVKDRLRRASAP